MTLTDEQRAEIEAQRAQIGMTRRAISPGLEEHLFEAIPVLDHGFVRVVDYMGNDAAIVQAARVSYGDGTRKSRDDTGLIRYLMRHWHSTPFEMCEIKLHVKLPIFIARQWIRHRTANVNEYSARYSILDSEYYIPSKEHLAAQSDTNRQGRGTTLSGEEADRVLQILKEDAALTRAHYMEMINEDVASPDGAVYAHDPNRQGLARELARMNATLNSYTQWYWKIDLHNLFHFLRLRADSHAQYEIRVYADAIGDLVRAWVPAAYSAFEDYRLNAANVSGPARAVLQRMLSGETVDQPSSGLSPGEWREFKAMIDG